MSVNGYKDIIIDGKKQHQWLPFWLSFISIRVILLRNALSSQDNAGKS